MHILLVEDSPGDARLVQELLIEGEVSISDLTTVSTLAEARKLVTCEEPLDALILDLNLPDSRGLATLQSVLPVAGPVAVIVLTGLGDEAMALHALEAGAQDFIVKGETNGVTLRKTIEFAVARRRLLAQLEATEARERFLNRLLQTTSEINQLIVRERDPDRLLHEAARLIVEAGEFLAAWFAVGDPATGTVRFLASHGVSNVALTAADIRCDDSPRGQGVTGTALRENRTVVVSDLATDDRATPWRETMAQYGLRSAIAVPLKGSDTAHGVLTVCAADPDSFIERSRDVFEELGADVGFALSSIESERQRARAEEELRWQARIDGALAELYEPLVAPGATIERVSEIVLRRARELTTSQDGYAATIEPGSGNLICHTFSTTLDACPVADEQKKVVFPPRAGGSYPALWGHSLNTRWPLVTQDPQNEKAAEGTPPGHVRLDALLSAPVLLGEELVGQISLANPDRPYTERDLDAIEHIARFYALAIHRIRADSAIQESERRYRELFERNLAGVYRTTVEGAILECNQAFTSFFGARSPSELDDVSAWDLYQTRASRERFLDALRTNGEVRGWQQEFRRLDGATVWALLNANLHDEGSRTIIEGTLADITANREAHEALAARERDYRGLFESAHDAIVVFDPDDATILDANQRATELYRVDHDQLIGASVRSLSAEPDSTSARMIDIAEADTTETFETRHRAADGRALTVEINASSVDYRGRSAILTIIRDITATRELEEQLHHSQRMEAIGRLAGGVAHDFNNLLQAVAGTVQALRSGREPQRRAHHLAELDNLVARGAQLTRQLLVFSRRDASQPQQLDLNEVVEGSQRMIARLIPESISVTSDLAPTPLHVLLDPGRLEQVLVNLAVNAADAMPDGGTLLLRTKPDADGVVLEVNDSGVGMSRDVAERVFEPFFTTKEAGAGTGLGLAVVHGIITSAGGTVSVASEPGSGTSFRIWLPQQEPPPSKPQTETFDSEPVGLGERVLAVDDNPEVREGVGEMLELLGYEVTLADGVQSALALEPDPPPDLLLTDMVLEDGAGTELAASLRARWPSLSVIVMSGYSQDVSELNDVVDAHYLQKPFTMTELARLLRLALGEDNGRHG
jgi:PAS domain S-box-containing protein